MQPVKSADSRGLVVARLVLSLARSIGAHVVGTEMFGSAADEIVLCSAILIGQAEGRPMTAAKVAAYAGIPRGTVVRKLQAMQERGLVAIESVSRKVTLVLREDDSVRAFRRADIRRIQRAAADLSRMDAQGIAPD